MMETHNPWKQYAFVILGAIAGLVAYLLSYHYGLADLRTGLQDALNLYQKRIYIRVPVLAATLAVALSVAAYLVYRSLKAAKRMRKEQAKRSSYISEEEYRKQGAELTEQELSKLQSSEEFKRALQHKGENPEKWNWQTSERKVREGAYKKELREQRAVAAEDIS